MCGIAGCVALGDKPLDQGMIEAMFVDLQQRGTDAAGTALISDNGTTVYKTALPTGEAAKLYPQMIQLRRDTHTVLLHARAATQGEPCDPENNHPIIGKDRILIHNGCVSTASNGYGASDTGQLLWQIENFGLEQTLKRCSGWMAIAMHRLSDPNKLWLFCDGAPLFFGWDAARQHLYFASTHNLIATNWQELYTHNARFGLFAGIEVVEAADETLYVVCRSAKRKITRHFISRQRATYTVYTQRHRWEDEVDEEDLAAFEKLYMKPVGNMTVEEWTLYNKVNDWAYGKAVVTHVYNDELYRYDLPDPTFKPTIYQRMGKKQFKKGVY